MSEEILNVSIRNIIPDPDVPNIRGPIRDTTDLQATIRHDGIERPLWVRELDKEKYGGLYGLIDGYRRLTAAKALGLKEVSVTVKGVGPEGVRRLMLLANMNESIPEIVLDQTGDVIGGQCEAVYRLAEDDGYKNYEIAEMLGEGADVVSAFRYLHEEMVEIKRRVEKGDLAITVYALMKRQPLEVKEYLLAKKGQISARYVRNVLRNWEAIQAKQEEADDVDPADEAIADEEEADEEEAPTPQEEYPVARCLNEAAGWLDRVAGRQLSPTDMMVLKKVEQKLAQVKGELQWA